jgi:DNA-binding NarL/FixJ family response regulator
MKIKLKDPSRNHLTSTERKAIVQLLSSGMEHMRIGRKLYNAEKVGRYYKAIILDTCQMNSLFAPKVVLFTVIDEVEA